MWTSSRPQAPQPQSRQTNSGYRQPQQQQQQPQPQRPHQSQPQQPRQYARYAAPPPPTHPPSAPPRPQQQQAGQSAPPPSAYYEADYDEAGGEDEQQYAEHTDAHQPDDYGEPHYEAQHEHQQQQYGDYAQHPSHPPHQHDGQQQPEEDDGPSQQELYDYDEQQQRYAEEEEQQRQQDEQAFYHDEQDDPQQQQQEAGEGDGEDVGEDGSGDYYEQQHYAQPVDDEQDAEAGAGFSQQPQPASPLPPGLPSAALHPVVESEHEPASPPVRPFAAAAALAHAASPSSPDSSSAALSPSSPPFSASSSLPAPVAVSEEEQAVYDDVVDAVLVLLRRAEGGGSAAEDEGEEAQWLSDLRQEYADFASSPPAAFLPFASSLLAADKLSLFARLLSAASESLQVSAACAALRVELEAELQRETDLTLLSASELQPATRPGLCCLRFTPAAIPASFHEALTLSLLAELQQRQPELYRRGELRTTGKDGAEGAEAVCVVVEASRLAVSRGAAALASELRRCSARVRLPEHAERQLSEHLKRGISQAESALKRGGGGGLGVSVIRSLPIVGSVFSFFAGSGGKKGHSYNISSSYDSGQQPSKDRGGSEGKAAAALAGAVASNVPAKAAASRAASAQAVAAGGAANQAAGAAASASQQRAEEEDRNGQAEAEQAAGDAALSSDTDALFEQLSARDPADLLRVMTEGSVVTCFFPSNPADPADLSASAVPLYLFFDPESDSLCWCEPGRRYVSAEQSLPIAAISELHLGSSGPFFPADAEESRCFSIVSDLITLHGEEQDADSRDELMLALYSLLNQAQQQQAANGPDQQQHYDQQQQQQQPRQQSRREERKVKTGDVMPLPPAAATAGGGGSSGPSSSSSSSRAALPLSAAVSLLESGSDWTVFLINRAEPSRTSRHPVVLWWSRDVDGRDGGKGRLCWARRSATAAAGASRLEYHPSRSLLLDGQLEVSLGKQSKAMLNAGMEDVDDGRCVSICVDRTVLNLAASSERDRDAWLAALHTVMIESGNKLVTQ